MSEHTVHPHQRVNRPGRRLAAAALSSMVLLPACGQPESEPDAPTEDGGTAQSGETVDEEQASASLEIAWESDDQLVGDVQQAADAALAYTAEDGMMHLVSRSLDSGRELWRKPALYGDGGSGQAPSPALLEREGATYAAYYAPADAGPVHYAVVDVATGEAVAPEAAQGIAGERPEACGTTFCGEGRWWYEDDGAWSFADEYREVAFDWEAGRWRPREDVDGAGAPLVSPHARRYGQHLSVSGEEDPAPMVIGYGEDGQLLWERPYAEIFGEDHPGNRSLAYAFDTDEDAPLVVSAWEWGTDGEVRDLETLASVIRLETETGETLWEAEGLDMTC